MKIFLLTILSLVTLIGCQTPQNKKTIIPEQKLQKQTLSPGNLFIKLNQCHDDVNCKNLLEDKLNAWLLEKNYITIEEKVDTDEQSEESVGQNSKGILNQPIIHLSSDLMNNELIRGALNEWLTWKRPQLINTWQYYQFMQKDIQSSLQKYGIEEAFALAIMAQESGGKVHARSRAGAGGLFQLMPATARRLGLFGKDGDYDLRFNPSKSSFAAAKYINEQMLKYDGDKAKVLAAYNSGENRFRYLNKKHKNKPLWNKNFYYDLPRETRHYVPVVLSAMLIFQNPQKFNVNFIELNNEKVLVSLTEETSLSELAICLGQDQREEGWFRILRNLNSGIKADKTIKANTDLFIPRVLLDTFSINCHGGELMKLAKSFHDADFKQTQGLFRYKVKSGDSLGKIAHKFRCTSRKEIAQINNLKAPRYLIRAGKYLKIPEC